MASNLPGITPEQRAEALAKARKTRRARAEVMEKLRTGKMKHEKAIADAKTDPIVGRIKVKNFLMTMHNVGVVGAESWMQQEDIPEGRRLSGLGVRQKEKLAAFAVSHQ